MLALFAVSLTLAGAGSPATALREEIRGLQARTAERPSDTAAWTGLAVAWRRHARLTGDHRSDDRALEAVRSALAADPDDYQALALKGWVEAARHDFEAAVVSAREAIARQPEDAWNHGVLADALTELGRYPEAVEAAGRMMRLKPGAAAYSRAAHLRGLHGDREGAIALMELAVEASSASDPESLAWCLVMLGRERQAAGDHARAQEQYRRALRVVADYHLALFHLAESQAAGGEHSAAIETAERLRAAAPSVALLALLGDLHAAAGRHDVAGALYREVDAAAALRDPSKAEPRWLARFYADQGRNLDQAIRLVEEELQTHQDVETWDGLAWALHRAGRHEQALLASERAAALGTVDARLLYHRAMIELASGRTAEGGARLERSLALRNLWPGEQRAAQQRLAELRSEGR
jgi:tetratricopeptide (TPR) repeat protein